MITEVSLTHHFVIHVLHPTVTLRFTVTFYNQRKKEIGFEKQRSDSSHSDNLTYKQTNNQRAKCGTFLRCAKF